MVSCSRGAGKSDKSDWKFSKRVGCLESLRGDLHRRRRSALPRRRYKRASNCLPRRHMVSPAISRRDQRQRSAATGPVLRQPCAARCLVTRSTFSINATGVLENIVVDALENVAHGAPPWSKTTAIGVVDVPAAVRCRGTKFAVEIEITRNGTQIVGLGRGHKSSGPELRRVIAAADEAPNVFDHEWTVLAIGDAKPGVRSAQHLQAFLAGANQGVDQGRDVKLGLFVLRFRWRNLDELRAGDARKTPVLNPHMFMETGFVAARGVDLSTASSVLGSVAIALDFCEFLHSRQVTVRGRTGRVRAPRSRDPKGYFSGQNPPSRNPWARWSDELPQAGRSEPRRNRPR